MSSHSTQTTDSNQHQTTDMTRTPTNPAFVNSTLQDLTGGLDNLANTDPHSFVAGPDALQTQAGAGAAGLTGTPGTYAGANDLSTSIGQMNAPDIASLMNPFKGVYDNRVINPVLAAFDQNSALQNAQNKLGLANDVTFGGSGGAITDALTRGQQALARGQVQGGLLSDMYKTALQGATSQAGVNQNQQQLRLAAANNLVNSANSEGSNDRANVATQGSIGSILQGLAQAQAGAPLTVGSTLAGIAGALPLGLLHGENDNGVSDTTGHSTTDTTQSNPLGTIGSLAMLAAAPFTGGASLMGGLGGLGAVAGGLGSLGGLANGMSGLTGLTNIAGNLANNDPTGMWRFG
jgi:hypothetical protein